MIPTQSTTSSRRSSILKIPRSRSSLIHGGDPNTSATDDSPTVTPKLKRRVSFAEKKHVKEFCDSIEQGTVWDSTYEESESSHMKTNQSDKFTEISQLSNTNGCQVQISTNVEVHSSITIANKSLPRSVPKLVRQNAIDCEFFPLGILNDSNKIRQSMMSNDPEFLVNKENIPEILKLSTAESSLVENERIVVCPRKSLNASPYPKFSVYCDDEPEKNNVDNLNRSNYENVSMECTMLAGDSSSPKWNNTNEYESLHRKSNVGDLEKTTMRMEKTQMFYDKSMEITEALPRNRFTVKPSVIDDEKTQFFQNKSMEITEAVPDAKLLFKPNCLSDERTQLFQNKSMEITEAVPDAKLLFKPNCLSDEKTQFFQNKSMEITEAVPDAKLSFKPNCLNDERTQFFQNKSMEITEAVPDAKLSFKPNCLNDERTQFFQNKSMEMTEVISQVKHTLPSSCLDDEKTKVFHNKSMEMTEAVPNMEFLHKSNYLSSEKTKIFHDNSMKMTGVFPNAQYSSVLNHLNNGKTTAFDNKSMEMTEAVSNIKFSNVPNCLNQEKPEVLHDDSMEMTGVIPFVKFSLSKPHDINDERTTVFHNKSMEMTEAISNVKFSINPRCTDEEKTQFFHNKSMEITKAVPCIKTPINHGHNKDRTRMLHNQSMETTEAITPFKFIMNQVDLSNNITPILPKNTTNIDRSITSTPHVEIDKNYFMELTEAIQSIKRPYNLVENANKSLSELSTPIMKNRRYSTISEPKKPISEEDLQKLHQLLHQDLSKINSLSQTELLQDNYCTSVKNVISDQQPTSDDNDAMEMTEAIPSIQQIKIYVDEIQDTNSVTKKIVEVPNLVEKVNQNNSTLAIQIDKSNELSNNTDNLHTFKENDLSKDNRSSEVIKSLQPDDNNTTKQFKVIESTSSNPTCKNTLEATNLLEVFNKVVGETSILLENKDVSFGRCRYQNKNAGSAQITDDITYDLTRPITQLKETEKTFLEFEEAPSFIYDQSLSDQYLKKKEEIKLFCEPPVPELSATEVFSPINTNNLKKNHITNILSEQEISSVNEQENNIKMIDCKVLDKNIKEKINRRATFIIKKHDDLADIVKPTTHSEVESTEKRIIYQSNSANEVCEIVNKVNVVTNLDKEEHDKIGNKMNDCGITKEQSICRPPTQANLLDADNESHVNDKQLISTNTVSKKRGREHVKEIIKKFKKHEDESVFLENDSIVSRIVQTAKEFANLRNEIKYMVKLGMSATNKTEKENILKDEDELITDKDNDKSPYEVLEEGLRMYEKNDECLWKIYDMNPKVICIEYYKTALLLLIKLNVPDDSNEYEQITNVHICSRLNDKELTILKIIDSLIIQRINTQSLVEEYKMYEDIPKLIQYVTNHVKVIYDFYDDFEKISRKYLVDISDDNRISFVLRSQHMSNIIRLSIKLNFFTNIHPDDFKSISLLGPNIQNHVEKLAKSTKPGSNFLSTYIKKIEQLLNVY